MSDELNEARLREVFRRVTFATIEDAGHMLHHERPEAVAALIEEFLDARRSP